MRLAGLVFGVLAAAGFAATAALAIYAGLRGPMDVFHDASMIARMVDNLLILCLVVVVIVGVVHRKAGPQAGRSDMLWVLGWSSLTIGGLIAARDGLISLVVAQQVHVTHFNVVAPSLASAMLSLSLGLLVAAVASAFNRPRVAA